MKMSRDKWRKTVSVDLQSGQWTNERGRGRDRGRDRGPFVVVCSIKPQ